MVTVAMGRCAFVYSLKASSFEGLQECFSCSYICFKSLETSQIIPSDLEKDGVSFKSCMYIHEVPNAVCYANIASPEVFDIFKVKIRNFNFKLLYEC